MQPEAAARRRLVDVVVEHGALIDANVARLARDALVGPGSDHLAAASRGELDRLVALGATSDVSDEVCARALGHLAHLEAMLAIVVDSCAALARTVADRLAIAEERDLEAREVTSSHAVVLQQKLADLACALDDDIRVTIGVGEAWFDRFGR